MQNWEINPATGDYIMEGGSPKETDSLRIPAYFRLKIPRTKWLYARDNQLGSDFNTLKKRQTTKDASQIETIGATALQPMADDGRAQSIEVEATATSRQGVQLEARIVKADGQIEELVLPSLGV
jgi:phage gp46-like protein